MLGNVILVYSVYNDLLCVCNMHQTVILLLTTIYFSQCNGNCECGDHKTKGAQSFTYFFDDRPSLLGDNISTKTILKFI